MALTISQQIAGATMTRAMQLARGVVKDQLKRQKIRLADTDAKEITSWALVYLEDHPAVIAEARPASRSGLHAEYSANARRRRS
jgi:hypothetical protein